MPDRPQLPARVDSELYYYLKYLRDRVSLLEQAVGVTDTPSGSDGVEIAEGFEPVYETPVVLAGVGESEDTEDAWTTIAAGAGDARYAIIQFHMHAEGDSAEGTLSWRSSSGAGEIVAVIVGSTEDDAEGQRGRVPYFVPLVDGGFDYKADTTNSVDWDVIRIGYVL